MNKQCWCRREVERRKALPNADMKNQEKSTTKQLCACCGKQGHLAEICKCRNITCYSCGKAGHIANASRGKTVKLNNVEGTVGNEGVCDPFSAAMYNLGTNRHGIEIPVEINGKTI